MKSMLSVVSKLGSRGACFAINDFNSDGAWFVNLCLDLRLKLRALLRLLFL